MNQYPPWTAAEDIRLIAMRENGATGQEIYSAFSPRSLEAVRHHLHTLRERRAVR